MLSPFGIALERSTWLRIFPNSARSRGRRLDGALALGSQHLPGGVTLRVELPSIPGVALRPARIRHRECSKLARAVWPVNSAVSNRIWKPPTMPLPHARKGHLVCRRIPAGTAAKLLAEHMSGRFSG